MAIKMVNNNAMDPFMNYSTRTYSIHRQNLTRCTNKSGRIFKTKAGSKPPGLRAL